MLPTVSICNFEYLGARELRELSSKPSQTNFTIKIVQQFGIKHREQRGYAALVSLPEYYKFITSDQGEILSYLFDANVRDHLRKIKVNKGIRATLDDPQSEDFWWLNNGVTVIATKAWNDTNELHIEEPMIVNGLQTSYQLYEYFRQKPDAAKADSRPLLS